MSKKAIVILAEGFEEIEAVTIIDILRRANIDVTIAGLNDLKIKGSHGVSVLADKKLTESGSEYDALIFPGGMPGTTNLANSEKVKMLLQKMHSGEKLIAAICASPAIVLAPMGILKNKSATCYPGMQEKFDSSIKYKDEDVVVDVNIITSKGPGTALKFSLKIVEKLIGKEVAESLKNKTLVS